MKIETLHDILNWTRELHRQLSSRLHASIKGNQQERAKLLLDYLADHEQKLSKVLKEFESSADGKALNTYVYEWARGDPIDFSEHINSPFKDLDAERIMAHVIAMHDQLIELYRRLDDQFESPPATELIRELLQLEQHETMRIAQAGNRFQDI